MNLVIGRSYRMAQYVGQLKTIEEGNRVTLQINDKVWTGVPVRDLVELPGYAKVDQVAEPPKTSEERAIEKARSYKPTIRVAAEGYIRVSYREDKYALLEAHFESIGLKPPAGIQPVDEHARGGVTRTFGVSFQGHFPLSTPLSFFGDYSPFVRDGEYEIGITEFCKDCIASGMPVRFKGDA